MVAFGSFITTKRLESVIKTIGSLSYLVNKADLNANQGEAVRYPVNDREVRSAVARICPMMFPDTIGRLDESVLAPVRNTGYCLKEMRKIHRLSGRGNAGETQFQSSRYAEEYPVDPLWLPLEDR